MSAEQLTAHQCECWACQQPEQPGWRPAYRDPVALARVARIFHIAAARIEAERAAQQGGGGGP